MIAKSAAILALALAAQTATAEESRYYFAMAGFTNNDLIVGGFSYGYYLGGYFTGEDLDGDGTLQLNELSDFAYTTARNTPEYLMTHVTGPAAPAWCVDCAMLQFEYDPSGIFSFAAHQEGYGRYVDVSTGGYYASYYEYWEFSMSATPRTTIYVGTSPVPEPTTWMMLGLGAGIVAAATRRRRA